MNNNFLEEYIIKFTTNELLIKIVDGIMSFFNQIKDWTYQDYNVWSCQDCLEWDINDIVKKVTLFDATNIGEFQASILKRIPINEISPNADLNILIIVANANLNLLKNFFNFINNKNCRIPKNVIEEINIKYESTPIQSLLESIKYKGLRFNKKSFFICSDDKDMQLKLLDEKKLNEYFHGFLSTTSIVKKTSEIITLSCVMGPILNELKKVENSVISEYFNKGDLTRIILKCQGFRHLDKNDSNPEILKFSSEWLSYKPETKLQIMDNMFSIYLTILTILKGANLLDEILSKLNSDIKEEIHNSKF